MWNYSSFFQKHFILLTHELFKISYILKYAFVENYFYVVHGAESLKMFKFVYVVKIIYM